MGWLRFDGALPHRFPSPMLPTDPSEVTAVYPKKSGMCVR